VALVIHKQYLDGTIEHEPFSRLAWEEAQVLRKHYAKLWAHAPTDCVDPAVEILGRSDANRQKFADTATSTSDASCTSSGAVTVPTSWDSSLGPFRRWDGPVEFPPPYCGTAITELHFLSQMSGLCVDDARATMLPKIESKLSELPPPIDRRGQFLLF
jgi:hypothetical protein